MLMLLYISYSAHIIHRNGNGATVCTVYSVLNHFLFFPLYHSMIYIIYINNNTVRIIYHNFIIRI